MNVNATSTLNDPVKMKVYRNPLDVPAVRLNRTTQFTLEPTPPETARPVVGSGIMTADSRGSFYIFGWIDDTTHGGTVNDGIFQNGELACALPIIIVSADLVLEDSQTSDTDIKYVPNPTARFAVTVNQTGELGATIHRYEQGAGYSATDPPTVIIDPPPTNGTQASAEAHISGDAIDNLIITDFGSGYDPSNPPKVTISAPTLPWVASSVEVGSRKYEGGHNPAIDLYAKVQLVGGIAGLLGTDRVYVGWCNQVDWRFAQYANYTNDLNTKTGVIRWVCADGGPFPPAGPRPVITSVPLLDTGRNPRAVGGGTILLSRSTFVSVASPPSEIGRRIEVRAEDSPKVMHDRRHDFDHTLIMNEMGVTIDFKTFLTLWTNPIVMAPSNLSPNQKAGERNYYDMQRYDWRINARYSVNTVTGVGTVMAATSDIFSFQGPSNNYTTREFSPISHAGAALNNHETRNPAVQQMLKLDYTTNP